MHAVALETPEEVSSQGSLINFVKPATLRSLRPGLHGP